MMPDQPDLRARIHAVMGEMETSEGWANIESVTHHWHSRLSMALRVASDQPVAQGDPKPGDDPVSVAFGVVEGFTMGEEAGRLALGSLRSRIEYLEMLLSGDATGWQARAEAAEAKVERLEYDFRAVAHIGHENKALRRELVEIEADLLAEASLTADALRARAEAAEAQLAQAREALREIRVYAVRLDELFSPAPLGGQLPSVIVEVIDALARLEQGDKDAG